MFFNFFKRNSNDVYEKTKKLFLKKLTQYEWDDEKAVKELIEDAVIIEASESSSIEIGKSKFGGTPDLPSTIVWPKFQDKSMLFFAQINLSEISELHRSDILPKDGFLYIFAYFPVPSSEYGADYLFIKDKKEYSIMYFRGSIEELNPAVFPVDIYSEYRFKSKELSFKTSFQLPSTTETGIIERSSLSQKDREQILNFSWRYDDGILDQILGHPVPVQYGADFSWALSYLDINLENGELESKKSEIDQIRPEFINLLTFPLFNPIGDSQIYIGILRKDLQNRDFSKTIFVLQDT